MRATINESGGKSMGISRLYTGSDGQSHIEELVLESRPDLTTLHAAKGVIFRQTEPGRFSDWHNGPRRQYVITLSGEAEIGLGDGTVHRFGPGHVNLVEDLTGQGHTTRVVGNQPRITVTIPLED
jgi:quercetin dioxygenase-like cupin family protein